MHFYGKPLWDAVDKSSMGCHSLSMETWSKRVIELESIGWSLTALAKEIGLSVQALSDVKHGRSKAPSGMAAVKLHAIHAERRGPNQEAA